MSVQHVNALRFNWKKIEHIINACLYICVKYKEPVTFASIKVLRIKSREKALEPLLKKLARQPLVLCPTKEGIMLRKVMKLIVRKTRDDCWFFSPGWICHSKRHCKRHNCQELIFAFPLLTSGCRLWKITILFWTGKKCQCFLIKRWLNSIFLGLSKLKSLALLIDNFSMLQDNNDLHLIGSKLKLWYIFLFKSSNFGKVESIDRNFWLKMIKSRFLFANITNKMTKLTSRFSICFLSSNLYEIHANVGWTLK